MEKDSALSVRLLCAACIGARTNTRRGNIDPERIADEVSTTGGGSIGFTGALTLTDFQRKSGKWLVRASGIRIAKLIATNSAPADAKKLHDLADRFGMSMDCPNTSM
jgi:hypothetical protein